MSSDTSLNTSQTLLDRVGSDDHEAWMLFVRLYGPVIYSWCRNAGLQGSDVEDVGQEIFHVVSKKLSAFEAGRKSSGAFRSWLWGISRLQILDHLRTRARQPVGQGGTEHNLCLHRLEQTNEEPESINGVTPQQVLLKSAIDMLKSEFDSRTWQVFWEMAVKGRPAKDVGEEHEMTAKAVRQAKFRVTKKLRELLSDDLPELVNMQTVQA